MSELTIIIDIAGRTADEAEGHAYELVCATMRLLPGRPELTVCLDEENRYSFKGDEDSLRLLHALAVGRGISYDGDTFEELAGVEDGPRTRLVALAGHRAS